VSDEDGWWYSWRGPWDVLSMILSLFIVLL
jgi:hypothetical protein